MTEHRSSHAAEQASRPIPQTNGGSLDVGLRAAFGPASETPDGLTPSVAQVLSRRVGPLSQISLRDVEDDNSPILRPRSRSLEQRVPGNIDRFQVAGEIARGGVGAVLKARDVDLGRDIALKVLLDEYQDNPDMIRRFVEEAQIAGQLQHPGIVAVHEMGLFGGKRPYFAMKLVKGQTLSALLKERQTPGEDRQRFLGVFEQVCQTLAYAHTRGVIHRDLKPSNIMVGTFGEVQVMDWGLAKVLSHGGLSDDRWASKTRPDDSAVKTVRSASGGSASLAGSVLGTPAYMPPEQARGEVDDLDERSDVFGLGAILCEVLTGDPPYTGKNSDDVFRRAKKAQLGEALTRLDGCGADEEVIGLAKRCLATAPQDRPPNAKAVTKQLSDYLESLEGRARKLEVEAAEARVKALGERRARRLTLALAIMAVVTLVLCGVYLVRVATRNTLAETAIKDVSSLWERVQEKSIHPSWTSVAQHTDDQNFVDDPLKDALTAAQHAVGLAEGARVQLHHKARQLRDDIQVALSKRRENREMLRRLDRLPVPSPSYYEKGERELLKTFEQAFRDYGIDVVNLDPQTAAERINESGIAEELAQALDVWMAMQSRPVDGNETDVMEKLSQIADRVDPNPWQRRMRQAVTERDVDELRKLAVAADAGRSSERSLLCLAAHLFRTDREASKNLLKRAWGHHPDSFWINYWLGVVLRMEGSADSRGHLRAAVALRRESPWVLRDIGREFCRPRGKASAWGPNNPSPTDFEIGIDAYTEAIRLDPSHYFSFYQVSLRVLQRPGVLDRGRRSAAIERLIHRLDAVVRSSDPVPDYARNAFLAAWCLKPTVEPVSNVLSVAIHDVEATQRKDRRALSVMAHVLWHRGQREEAIRTMEEALRLHGEIPTNAKDLIEAWRRAEPDLLTYASIDAAMDDAEKLERFVEQSGPDAAARRAYLDGRRLQLAEQPVAAAEKFNDVLALDVAHDQPEPYLRLAETLRDAGRSQEAEELLRDALTKRRFSFAEFWNLWLTISMVDLRQTPEQLLATFPTTPQQTQPEENLFVVVDYASDLRWLLERLTAKEPVQINCGGTRHKSASGRIWESDRFYIRGELLYAGVNQFPGGIHGTDEPPLYATNRWFPTIALPAGYRIPLPPGSYRVRLHFAEVFYSVTGPGIRVFNVLIEDEPVEELTGYDIMATTKAFATTDVHEVEAEVTDGILDIEFTNVDPRLGNPIICAIEVEQK